MALNNASKAKPEPGLRLSVQYPGGTVGAPTRSKVRRWVQRSALITAQITVRFIDAAEGQQLNRDYRGKDYATNVLSFPYEYGELLSGDLAICLPVVEYEAQAQNKPLEAHFAHLIVHGMLHLQGYDHETSLQDAEIMENMERKILATLGYPDPY